MGEVPEVLRPRSGERGLLTDLVDLSRRCVRAWELFHTAIVDVDLDAHTRSRGRKARELLIPLGAWDDARGIHTMISDARSGVSEVESESSAARRLRTAHATAPDAEVIARVHRASSHITSWLGGPEAATDSLLVSPSPLGPVPIGTLVHAAAFQLAVTVRDLRPAGAAHAPELDELGVVALLDSSGAVAARLAATASIAAITAGGAAGTGTAPGAWRTTVEAADDGQLGPAVVGPAGLMVDTAAGRIDLFEMARHLRVRDGSGLLGMSVVLDGIPDLPAAAMLRRAGSLLRLGRLG